MRGNLIEMSISTVTAGSPDTLTLAAVSGSPQYTDVFGTSGSRFVEYTAIQWTDSTRSVIAKAQGGVGSLNLATNVLTQTNIMWAWDGTTYDPTSPTEVTFTAGSSTTRVYCSMGAGIALGGMPFTATASPSEDLGMLSMHYASTFVSSAAMVVDQEKYLPHWWHGTKEIVQCGIRVQTNVASGACKHAIYECGSDGLPGKKIADIAVGTPYDCSTTGNKTASVSGLWLPPGWYYDGLIVNSSTIALRGGSTQTLSTPMGTTAGDQIIGGAKNGNYTTGLPDPASTGLTGITNAATPGVYWKQAA
jgi:hypothetical protein